MRRGRAQVALTPDDRMVAAYGPFGLETPLANVASYRLTGPYRWWTAIGPRGSLVDRGFTYGTSAHGGVCLEFRDPVPSRVVRGGRMQTLTVTVDDTDGLARALETRGVRGSDERQRA